MTGLWIVVVGVLLFDVLIARQVVVEYRRYRFRRLMQKITAGLHDFAAIIGEAFLPAIQKMTIAVGEFAKVFGELYEEQR